MAGLARAAMRRHGNDSYHQWARVRFGAALLALVLGLALLLDAGLHSTTAMLRGAAGLALVAIGIWAVLSWFRA